MFQNSYQNGSYFDLFDPKISLDKTKSLYRLQNVSSTTKTFDKQLKTYVFEFNNHNSKVIFPKEQRKELYLIQQFLNLQIYFYQGLVWNIELYISDLTKTKRRVILSTSTKQENKPFFLKFPCTSAQYQIWTNLTIDLYSFINAFKGQTYRSLDQIVICGHFKLRRIFTSQQPFMACSTNEGSKIINLLPKSYYFAPQIQCDNCMIVYEEQHLIGQEIKQNQSIGKSRTLIPTRNQVLTPKTTVIKSQKPYKDQKKFLADTNGPQKNRKKQRDKSFGTTQKSRCTQKVCQPKQKNQKSPGKSQTKKYPRQSLDKKKCIKDQQKQPIKNKSKINPWRLTKKNQSQTDGQSHLSQSKPSNHNRKIGSAETTLFKTKNKLANQFNDSKKGFDHRSDLHSDSDYVQLSQKFSTVAQGKFFRTQLNSQCVEKVEKDPSQIQENIQFEQKEMNELSNRKQQNQIVKQLKNQNIDQSINDSLDHLTTPCQPIIFNQKNKKQFRLNPIMMNSYYGFGQNLMDKYMNQVNRPYSPPLVEKEQTECITQKNQEEEDKQVELIYDPVLNCYYDHNTHSYYELKN